jgi:diguanylate cyclase (GGDEF)-like protein
MQKSRAAKRIRVQHGRADHPAALLNSERRQDVLGPAESVERLRAVLAVEVGEQEATVLWQHVARHRRTLRQKLGRDVGLGVAALDYLGNVRRALRQPRIIEAEMLSAIESDALSDGLTGLFNRRFFETALGREVERAHRYGVRVSLLLLDLDGFKAVNDTRGHQEGDRVLQQVAAVVRRHLRSTDLPCRFGGDEFAIILCDTPEDEALAVAERIRADVEAAFELPVTISAGLATLPVYGTSAGELVAGADRALYAAKRAGRNGTVPAAHT